MGQSVVEACVAIRIRADIRPLPRCRGPGGPRYGIVRRLLYWSASRLRRRGWSDLEVQPPVCRQTALVFACRVGGGPSWSSILQLVGRLRWWTSETLVLRSTSPSLVPGRLPAPTHRPKNRNRRKGEGKGR